MVSSSRWLCSSSFPAQSPHKQEQSSPKATRLWLVKQAHWKASNAQSSVFFLVPSTYLVVNYSIDLGNSLQYTIASEYTRLQGTDMYQDAMCAEIRAFGVRYIAENEGSLANLPQPDTAPRGNEPFAKGEGLMWGKLVDPCVGLNEVPANRDDNCMSRGSLGMRMAMNMSNAGINTAWSILTAFQMAFMYYLYFVGPIMAAL